MYLFVYGTLMQGFENPFSKILMDQADFIGKAYTYGFLYDIDSYPGLVEGSEKVYGELYDIHNELIFETLDAYEGTQAEEDGEEPYYQRVSREVFTLSGKCYQSQLYLYSRDVSVCHLISTGDYRAFLKS